MDVKRGYIIVSLGPNRIGMVRELVQNIRQHSVLPIAVVSEIERDRSWLESKKDVVLVVMDKKEQQWVGHPRWGVRNCNVFSAHASLSLFESSCVLNDDMRIVHPGHKDGFTLAERFGVCVPMNPRIYVKYNAMGTDAQERDYNPRIDGPEHAPACNMSPMFVCKLHQSADILIRAYIEELQTCMRGTLAFWRASWKTGITPVYLPEQWCVCASSAKHIQTYTKVLQGRVHSIEPMMLHWGQKEVQSVFA